MQESEKIVQFKEAIGEVLKEFRIVNSCVSLNKIANEYDMDKGSLSKIERGFYNVQIMTAWKLCESYGMTFSDFAIRLEEKLGKDFKFIDE